MSNKKINDKYNYNKYKEYQKKYQKDNIKKIQIKRNKTKSKYKKTIINLRNKNKNKNNKIKLMIDIDQYSKIINNDCLYCKKKSNKYLKNTADRLNSSKHYEIFNIVSSCFICNKIKSNNVNKFFKGNFKKYLEHIIKMGKTAKQILLKFN